MSVLSRAAIALSFAALGTTAQAAELVDVRTNSYSSNFEISQNSGATTYMAGASAFESTLTDRSTAAALSTYTYCIEPTVPGPYGAYEVVSGASKYTPVKLQALANLLKNGNEMLSGMVKGSTQYRDAGFALALAVWEITYETKSSIFNVQWGTPNVGNFRVYGGTDGAKVIPLTNTFLNNATNGTWTGGDLSRVKVLVSRDNINLQARQDLVIYDPRNPPKPPVGAVPEPATWAMLMVGFGAVGVAMRRRRDPNKTVRVRFA